MVTSWILWEWKITSDNVTFVSAPSAPPEDLVAASVSSTSFVLSWSPPPTSQQNGIIREYTVNITEAQTGLSIILNSTSTSVSVLSLHPYYTYECTVSAYTVGIGPYSDVFSITTSEDGRLHFLFLTHLHLLTKCKYFDKLCTCELHSLDCNLFAIMLLCLSIHIILT